MHGVARWRPASFFIRETKLAQEPANRIGMRLNAGRICKRTSQFRHGHVAVLLNKFDEKTPMGIEFAFAARATLGRGPRPSSLPDRKPNAPRWQGIVSDATPLRARLTLLLSTSEIAPVALPVMVLT